MRIALVACSAAKLEVRSEARHLYQGDLFRLSAAWVERRLLPAGIFSGWGILSARHGLVLPDQIIDTYDCRLPSRAAEKRAWSEKTRDQIEERWGMETIYTVLAGADYKVALDGFPYVEDLFGAWSSLRRARGIRSAACGIGVLKKYLKENRSLGC